MHKFKTSLLTALGLLSLAFAFTFNGGLATGSAKSAASAPGAMACPSPFTVNDLGDRPDYRVGDGVCADEAGNCTLRAALQEANAAACAPLTIDVGLTGVINLGAALPGLNHPNLRINGPGAASLNVRRNSADKFRIFTVNGGKTVMLNGLTISNGSANDNYGGGGIHNSGTLTIAQCVVTGNTSGLLSGGGIQNFGTLYLNQSALTGNTSSFGGGGLTLYSGGTATITDSTISGNSAPQGGGLVIQSHNTPANVIINNSTISGNTASLWCGGLFSITHGGTNNVTMINSTVAHNTGPRGSGICNAVGPGSANLNLKNTIVAKNTGAVQLSNEGSAVITSLGNNLFSDASLPAVAGDLLNTNPLLATLGNYGGPTRTHALLPGSPAINAGNNADTAETDQRGVLRAFQGTVDIGAYESRGFTLALSGGDNQSARINTAFANLLRIVVTSNFGDPVNGGRVTFGSPTFGAAALFAHNPAAINQGQASLAATANAIAGSYPVTAAANGANAVTFNLTNTCQGKGCPNALGADAAVADDGADDDDNGAPDQSSSRSSGGFTSQSAAAKKPKGCFTCDFGLPGNLPLNLVPPIIERDRMYMAERPGMQTKHLPLRIDFNTGNLLSGGRYLFDTFAQAEDYKDWVTNDFILDGISFLQRPIFLAPECHAWQVVGVREFSPVNTQIIMRTERWSVPNGETGGDLKELLKQKWNAVQAEAAQRGMSSVWLTYNDAERLAQLVYFTNRIGPQDPNQPDFASLAALENAPALGDFVNQYGWQKTFDRTQWVLTIWFPFVTGDHGLPSLWPHSPPFPQPFSGDGVCEVSRGENSTNSPTDCGPQCGNGVCDAGENTWNCPGDCRLP